MKIEPQILIIFLAVVMIACKPVFADELNWDVYDQVLDKYVSEGERQGIKTNLVNYTALAEDPGFAIVVEQIRSFDVSGFASKNEKLAFYINAYNVLTMQLILDHWPTKSIKDIGGFFKGPWDIVMLNNADGKLTLQDIEHKILRKMNEPRIHFVINCASLSCPDIARTAFRSDQLEAQLEHNTLLFLQHQGKGAILKGATLEVTRLFDWYESDFDAEGGVEKFIQHYLPALSVADVETDLDYNWSINGF